MPIRPIHITHRDLETFEILFHLPLTTNQIFRISQTFNHGFASERVVYRRLNKLAKQGLVRRYYFAFPSHGRNPIYWRLTADSFGLIKRGNPELQYRKSTQRPVGVSLHKHSYCLTEVVIKLLLDASKTHLTVSNFLVEKAIQFGFDGEGIVPDATLELTDPSGKTYLFFVELDTGSERIDTLQRMPASIKKKLDFYQRFRTQTNKSFRVLLVTTSSQQRATNILRFAKKSSTNPAAQMILATHFNDLLGCGNSLNEAVFKNHNLKSVNLAKANRVKKP